MVTLEKRIDRARRLRKDGYNCAQCVIMVFDDITPLDADSLAPVAAGFGTGIGGMREVCGAVSGMAMITGMTSYTGAAGKPALYGIVRADSEKFAATNGSMICRELKKPGAKPCIDLIIDAITILHNRLTPES